MQILYLQGKSYKIYEENVKERSTFFCTMERQSLSERDSLLHIILQKPQKNEKRNNTWAFKVQNLH